MDAGHFYYIQDQYFIDFPDPFLMRNKETIAGKPHGRPCFFSFKDENNGLFWMIPISSQTNKYRRYYNQKITRYNRCDTIVFGEVLGYEKAFLIQNMCPLTINYIKDEYRDQRAHTPVRINGALEREVVSKAKKVLALQRKGINLIFPDVLFIERQLLMK